MFTLYAPASGRVERVDGAAVTVACGVPCVLQAPTRGTVTTLEASRLVLTDLRGRLAEVIWDAAGAAPLVALADEVGFDAPLVDCPAGASVVVGSPGATDVLPHVTAGSDVVAGADLLSVGPFACGA